MSAQPLWAPVDCACGKPAELARARSTPLQEINLLYLGDVVDALSTSVEVLAARVDAYEFTLNQLFAFVEQPLPPEVLIGHLKQLREEIKS